MKDAKGHGSNARGNMSVPDRHQYKIAVDTVKNPMKGMFLGGPNAAEAEATLRSKFGHTDADIAALKGEGIAREKAVAFGDSRKTPNATPLDVTRASHDYLAAQELARGVGPKAAAAPVHPGASGRSDTLNSDKAKTFYGPSGTFHDAAGTAYPSRQSAINRIKQPADVIGRPWKGSK